ncbi:lipoprotein [Spiroplasma endosymbiont of Phyllotreta cruciferae]|uniref:lipoprotein n=1 Tax=Spiroplasma endosymbiont of Phyllotreta cruciferae TaxID=2886375 RepID=UPI0020A122BB|nr:lipoprotein [Spiroplasma endosymbiont of Phyllotreta cruciferae]
MHKKLLSILGTIALIGTSTTSLVACNTPQEYTKEQLAKLKEENKINTTNQQIRDNLEWITPQEKPFKNIDDKWYYVVWRGDKNDNWRIIKFKHFEQKEKVLDNYDKYELKTSHFGGDLFIYKNLFVSYDWNKDDGTYFKSVYRWNLDTNISDLLNIDENGNIKVK